eukprot:UN24004
MISSRFGVYCQITLERSYPQEQHLRVNEIKKKTTQFVSHVDVKRCGLKIKAKLLNTTSRVKKTSQNICSVRVMSKVRMLKRE